MNIIGQYTHGTEQAWLDWKIAQKKYHEVGFYKFFTIDQIPLMRHLQIATTAIAPALFIPLAQKIARESQQKKIFIALGSLKITLLFFYNFIELPFAYVFLVPAVISYVIGFHFLCCEPQAA